MVMVTPNLLKRCDNPPCHELAPYPEPYCCPRCKKSHTSTLYHRQHFSKVKKEATQPKVRKRRMTDEEQEQINRAANAVIAERMARPLDTITARRMGAMV